MKSLIKKNTLMLTGVVIGLISGYLYYKFIGCSSSTCLITSKPINATLYGGLMGGLLFSLFTTKKEKKC
jgi:LytS/YehU family sensor histidine kinase